MNQFSVAELNSFSSTQQESLQDLCNIQTPTTTYNEFGEAEYSYTVTSGVACGLWMTGGVERIKDQIIVLDIDGILRLPIDTVISEKDRVEVTERFGVAVSGLVYDVISYPKRGPSGIQVNLKKVNV